ncbi:MULTISPECIES: hypothetical protein [Pseudomonas]|uniref:hypothetical protein n=1 Tax=Pseudomonas TaxID=286 RepID=UPI000F82863E|nr:MULTISPECIES: hypothetical protein [Pseudomonas]MDY7553874.1 hypothetical protein [Pseudomonas sp. FG1]MEB0053329.1 hypothetical protein [Pseudomonas sp. FG1]RTY66841.1 hypothetical protein EKA85_11920 [Pseudomonas veronii]
MPYFWLKYEEVEAMGLISRERTKAYFDWAAVREPYKSKELTLSNGVFVESCGRHRGDGQIQLFVGVYTAEGKPVLEDYTSDVQGMTVDEAIDWGMDRAKSIGNGQKSS